MKIKPLDWYFYGCSCGFFKSSNKMMGKCPRCGKKLKRYRSLIGK